MRGIIGPILAALGLSVALSAWALSSPIGSAPDDTYHLPTTWCSWGVFDQCTRDEDGGYNVPEVVADICTFQRPSISASCESMRGDQLVRAGHLDYVTSPEEKVELKGNLPYHHVMRAFVGPGAEASALNMRFFNSLLAGVMLVWALLISGRRARLALAASWLLTVVPVGMFILSSTNPSGWAITGVGVFWAFAYSFVANFRVNPRRSWIAGAGALVATFIAIGARVDAAVFIGASLVMVSVLAWPELRQTRALLVGGSVLLGVISVGVLLSSVRDRLLALFTGGNSESFSPDPGLTAGGLNPDLNHLLELPSYLFGFVGGQSPIFSFPTAQLRGLGWLDTSVPSITGLFVLVAMMIVIGWGLNTYNKRKMMALAIGMLVLVGAVFLPLHAVSYTVTYNIQPRYFLPILFVVVAVAVFGARPRIRLLPLWIVIVLVTVANATALLANLHRYTNGQAVPWMRLDLEPNWWWQNVPLSPNVVWLIGALGFSVFAIGVGMILRPARPVKGKQSLTLR